MSHPFGGHASFGPDSRFVRPTGGDARAETAPALRIARQSPLADPAATEANHRATKIIVISTGKSARPIGLRRFYAMFDATIELKTS
jgi:hypothetical protein